MKKKNIGKIFLVTFIKSFIVIMVLLLVGAGSYRLTMMYYRATDEEGEESGEKFLNIVGDVTAGEVSSNLVYKVSEDGKTILGLVLELFNTKNNNLDYVTIPETMRFTVSNEMYQRISVVSPETPQIIYISRLKEYFEGDAAYEYGVILLQEHLGVDVGYYTAMDEKEFDAYLTKREVDGAYVLTDQAKGEMGALAEAKNWEDYIEERYQRVKSNLRIKQKLKYTEALTNMQPDKVYSHVLAGAMVDGAFEADVEGAGRLYRSILGQASYTVSQDQAEDLTGASMGKNIEILNSTGVSGLAASFQQALVQDGYTVGRIGDYTGGAMEETKIYVRKKGMGADLSIYFKQAEVEVQKLEKGVDIQIIVGMTDVPS